MLGIESFLGGVERARADVAVYDAQREQSQRGGGLAAMRGRFLRLERWLSFDDRIHRYIA